MDPAADAGRVHEAPGLAAQLDQLVDGVTGGARNLVDDDAVLAREPVEQTRLAHVGTADQRHTTRTTAGVGVADRRELGKDREKGIEDVTATPAVQGRDRPRLAESEGPQHRRIRL